MKWLILHVSMLPVARKEVRLLTPVRRYLIMLLVLCLCLVPARPAHATIAYASDGKAIGVIIAVVAIGALIGFGIYYAVHHGHSLKGCTAASSSGLELVEDGDKKHYMLMGDVQGIKPGDRLHVQGNKGKKAGAQDKTFTVTKVAKNYGACTVS